jgi:hypothetical protein
LQEKKLQNFDITKLKKKPWSGLNLAKKKILILCDTLVKEFIPKEHGAVNFKVVMYGSLFWVSFTGEFSPNFD